MRRVTLICFAIGFLNLIASLSHAQIRLPAIFTDHMVLQRQKEIKIWGWAEPGQKVQAKLNDELNSTEANEEGKWMVTLPAQEAGGPFQLEISDPGNPELRRILKDILIGEVWLCSGQSNMEWTVAASKDPRKEIAAANFPKIRHIKMPHRPSSNPQENINTRWTVCSPETVAEYTAVGYYFGRKLHQDLDVPIGLINASWGGTRIEPWTTPAGFADVPALRSISDQLQARTPGTPVYSEKMQAHLNATQNWLKEATEAFEAQKAVSPSPQFPAELTPVQGHQNPAMLYNGMVHNFVGFPLRGAIWYQGESNRADGMMYFEKKKALINGWRNIWEQGDFPFYFVQIAPFQYGNDRPEELAELWEAQSKTLELPNTGMVVVSDVGNLKDIHPKNKQTVGARLANLALKNDYGQDDLLASGPTFESLEVGEDRLVIKFSNVGEGLKSLDGEPLNWFEVIGQKTGFEKANAEISGNTVILTSDAVKKPVAMRFAWNKLAEPNLANSANLPASPFRAGQVPTALSAIPGIENYELVYDLDLSRLGAEIEYDVDQSDKIRRFDRIGYFMELKKANEPAQYVFVSMIAFTNDIKKIGIPTLNSKAVFQRSIAGVEIYTNADMNLPKDLAVAPLKGHIEFWPNNYGPVTAAKIGGSDAVYDIDDTPGEPSNGYGSMQVHIPQTKQTLFAINRWSKPDESDLGIGNSAGQHPDWTFSNNSGQYVKKRLRVFVLRDDNFRE